MLDSILGFIGKGIDAFTSSSNTDKTNAQSAANAAAANAAQERINEKNIANQREFAQQGVRWKVADAQAAGLHPLAALGAQTSSFSNVVGDIHVPKVETAQSSNFGGMGQDIGRAMDAGATQAERQDRLGTAIARTAQVFSLEKMNLENELLKSSIAKERATTPPPFPASALAHLSRSPTRNVAGLAVKDKEIEQSQSDVPEYATHRPFGYQLRHNPYVSDAQVTANRFGEAELGETAKWIFNAIADHGYTAYKDWIPSLAGAAAENYRTGSGQRIKRFRRGGGSYRPWAD